MNSTKQQIEQIDAQLSALSSDYASKRDELLEQKKILNNDFVFSSNICDYCKRNNGPSVYCDICEDNYSYFEGKELKKIN